MRALFFVVSITLIASCGGDGDSKAAHWQKLGELRPSSLLAAWADSPDNVWIVGGREGAGGAPVVWHYDGSAWTKHDTGLLNVDLWQVFGVGGTVFFGGSNGTILRYRDGTFVKLTTPAPDIVFGLWGTSETDVWAVGGQFSGKAFVWRYQGGTEFTAMTGVPTELDTGGAVWKVTGRSASDVWMSASRGLVLRWDGQALSSERIGATGETLFSIGCSPTVCVAAGSNITNGVLYENAGSGWVSAAPTPDGPIWRGVTPVGDHQYVVGQFGAVLRRDPAGWTSDPPNLTDETLHAAWADADGNLYAVGGKFDRPLTIDGVLLFKGATELSPLP